MNSLRKINHGGNFFKSVTTEDLLLEHGREWTPAKLPPGMERGQPKMCFMESSHLAIREFGRRNGLVYCEGYAISDVVPIPLEHAWCVTKSGHVVDTVWDNPQECHYFGIPFRTDFLKMILLKSKHYGLLDCYSLRWPLQNNKWPVGVWLNKDL